MVKKLQKTSTDKSPTGAQLSGTIKDSASQIWLAGLGAFAKAQEEGGKVFEALVKEGLTIQRKTQSAAEEKISEATNRMASMASGLSTKATGQWDKLEGIFEERVARALKKLGVPTSAEIEALAQRVEELNRNVERLGGRAPAAKAKAPARTAARSAAKPAARKRTAARKSGE